MGLILANLDCELTWARACTPGPHSGLPRPVVKAVARASQVLTVFDRGHDSLWTMTDVPVDVAAHGEVLAWGQVESLPPALERSRSTGELGTWQDALWHLRAHPGSAARCNDRRFARSVALDDEWTLPEVTAVDSLETLDHYLQTSRLGPGDAWVAKAPFSASGRERMRRHGRLLAGEERVRTGRLLARYGQLVVEPWMPRTADYGCAGLVYERAEDLMLFPPHQLESDSSGVFRSVRIADSDVTASLDRRNAQALQDTAERAGLALHAAGYRGPFGIDAFSYTTATGQSRLQTMSEINARMCFGLVARALAEKARRSDFEFRV